MGLVANVRHAVLKMRSSSTTCTHLDQIRDVTPASNGCDECLALGDTWVHLRMCMSCGKVGCCDSSVNKHARKHSVVAGHQIIRSIQPGEDWMWCFADDTLVEPP